MTGTFWLNQETMGTVAGRNHRIVFMIPKGGNIEMVGPVLEIPDQVEVLWNGQSVWLFACDLEARGIPSQLAKAASVGGETSRSEVHSEGCYLLEQPIRVKPIFQKIRRFNAAGRETF
ncbi:MAG: hypothetical protein ABI833_06625 [Acidobacteriota bacterium]